MSGKLSAALLILTASGTVQPLAGQNPANDRLAAARAQLHAMRFDSAAILLRGALDGSDRAMPEDQAEALVLLGVIAFYKGDDSGAAGAFRHALALDPLFTGGAGDRPAPHPNASSGRLHPDVPRRGGLAPPH